MSAEISAGPPVDAARPFERLIDVATTGRLIVAGIGLVLSVFEPFGSIPQQLLTVALIGCLYLPYSVLLVARRRRLLRAWPVTALLDFGTAFLFQFLVPSAYVVALFGYLFLVVYYTTILGVRATIASTLSTIALSQVAHFFGASAHRVDQYTLIMFLAVTVMTGFMIEAATREQRWIIRQETDLRFAGIAHDIRLPLASIAGLSETLVDRWHDLNDETRAKILAVLYSNVSELDDMVQDLIEFSNVTGERILLRPQPVQLARFVTAFLEQHASALAAERVWLSIPANIYASADPNALTRVLGNLIANAVEYSPAGGSVRVVADSAGDVVRIHVENDAPAMSDAEFERVFSSNETRRWAGERRHGGIGIGIARSYAAMLGGGLTFTRTVGGVRASFSLPAYDGARSERRADPPQALPA